MKKIVILILSYIWLVPAFGQGDHMKGRGAEFRLLVEQETAYDFKLGKFQKSELIIDPEITWRINDKLKFFGQLRLYAELTDQLDPGKPQLSNYSALSKPFIIGDRIFLEIREFYLDVKLTGSYWRLGKQQIVVGETEGFKVLDLVNPMSFREFILDDFDDSRIPLWSIKGEFRLGPLDVETFWIPDLTYHHFPGERGLYKPAFNLPEKPEEIEIEQSLLHKPDHIFKDSDLGFRLSGMIEGWDLSFIYLYQYDNTPVIGSRSFSQDRKIILEPAYHRNHMFGTTFNNTFGSFGLRGEAGYIPDKYFTHPGNNSNGLLKTGQIISGVGLDYFGLGETLITLQWFADWIMESGSSESISPARRNLINGVTVMIDRFFLNQTINVRIFSAYGIEDRNGMSNLKISYMAGSAVKLWAGGDIYYGTGEGIIGQFSDRNRVLVGIQWGMQSK